MRELREMKERTLQMCRFIMADQYTLGFIELGKDFVFTLERPWDHNKRGVSCIPAGFFNLTKDEDNKWKEKSIPFNIFSVVCKPQVTRHEQLRCERFGILIHPANVVDELSGCIAPGLTARIVGGEAVMLRSADAMIVLSDYIEEHNINMLRIRYMI